MLEDMLRACVLDHKGRWEERLPLVEFSYNNSYQASIQMAPYESTWEREDTMRATYPFLFRDEGT